MRTSRKFFKYLSIPLILSTSINISYAMSNLNLKTNTTFGVTQPSLKKMVDEDQSSNLAFASNAIAGGLYLNTNGKIRPLIANSFDGGATWSYPASIITGLPVDTGSQALFTGASCSGWNCVAGGYFRRMIISTNTIYPLLASSQDGGRNWRYPSTIISALPLNFKSGSLDSFAKCSGEHCIAAGTFTRVSNKQLPLLAISHDKGFTWDYPTSILTSLPPDFLEDGFLYAATSKAEHFFAVGQYKNVAQKLMPLLATSHDRGDTWTYPSSVTINLPSDYRKDGAFNSAVCSVAACIAVGEYASTEATNLYYPLIAVSHDNGLSWKYLPLTDIQLPADFDSINSLNSVSCNANNCIAAGEYRSNRSGFPTYPYLVSSQDGGLTWKFPTTILSELPFDYKKVGTFHGAHCNREICIAVGSYQSLFKGNKLIPLIASSLDGGKSWVYPESVSTDLPIDLGEGELFGVHCNRADCVAEGQYQAKAPNINFYPLIATSHDAGQTWTYPSTVKTNIVSDYFDHGIFSGGYSSFTLKKLNALAQGSQN